MKLRVSQNDLNKALGLVARAVTARSSMPILKGILFSVDENDILTLLASDTELSIEKKIHVYDSEPGAAVIPARLIQEIVRKLPDEDIYISLEDFNNINVRTTSSEFRIVGMDAAEFPEMGTVNEERKLKINSEIFREMIQKTSFAASIDKSKGVIVGILIEMLSDRINMAALDGFRMAVAHEEAHNDQETEVIISAKILSEINKILVEDFVEEGDIELILDEHKAVIFTSDSKIIIRIIAGKYLDYKKLIPAEYATVINVDRMNFIASIERASLFAKEGRNNLIKLHVTDDNIQITSQSDAGNVNENIPVRKDGNDIEIGFNSKYLIDGLKAIDEDTVLFKMNSNVTPCVIQPFENQNYTYLILPVRIIS